ncbi:zinc finger CCCH domain-containing protein 8 [Vombatus ursinus]|uniref:zinc finger CCCH domain-containing protein 8 n=1 Tax=Vombatus ursinus TaxID=29139 RepID=UPI000FFCF249|nr:zinc finger CCCH domain-containing protein 8 [Vombatus ursinus]XP_027714963.1 zinc finger CCCH domain-containing protein 8 [Vombatus ursinus]XP_027714964.1 zinc finger CCCH domain-containing protein 8 [Vombatus ursinus]XP_027714965.1 zinc finger CCCH domain-containing protein 8 [Vombatus ursinus]
MSSTLFPTGLVPFEDLFSKPPNPMLGPSLTQGPLVSGQEGCRKLTCPQLGPGLALNAPPTGPSPSPTGSGDLAREPSSPCQASDPPLLELSPGSSSLEDVICKPPSPDGPGATETLSPCSSPRWDFGDLFCKPPNPMLSSSMALSGLGTVACEPPALPSPRPDSGPRPRAASPGGAACSPAQGKARPKKCSGQGGSLRPDSKRRGKKARASVAKGRQPQEEDFAQLLEQYRREREAPEVAPVPPPVEGGAKRGAKRSAGAGSASRAKKRKRAGPAKGPAKAPAPRRPAGPPAAPERAPVSEEFVQKNTVALGSQRVCKYFLAGRCVRGEQCRLDHGADGLKFQQLCKFYVQGYCTRGDHCRFLHNEFPCKFFHTGAKCYQGDHCGFSHAPLTPETEGLLRAALAGPAPVEAAPPTAPS